MTDEQNTVSDLLEDNQYKYGFTTDVESETFAKGLNEDVVHNIFVETLGKGFRLYICCKTIFILIVFQQIGDGILLVSHFISPGYTCGTTLISL